MPEASTASATPAVDAGRTRQPVRGYFWGLAIGVLMPLVTPATALTVVLGRAPYDRLFQGYPGVDVGVLTSILNAIAGLSGIITCGSPQPSSLPQL